MHHFGSTNKFSSCHFVYAKKGGGGGGVQCTKLRTTIALVLATQILIFPPCVSLGKKGDCTLVIKDSDFLDMASGKLPGQKVRATYLTLGPGIPYSGNLSMTNLKRRLRITEYFETCCHTSLINAHPTSVKISAD